MRAPLVLVATLAAGCGLVSGLDGLAIDDGGSPTGDSGGVDGSADVTVLPDGSADVTPPPGDAGRARTALATKGGCSSAIGPTTLALSNSDFTVSLWLRVDAASSSVETQPILWKGGRSSAEPGWMLALQSGNLVFCVADSNGSKCSAGWAILTGHLVHVVVRSTFVDQVASSREVWIYKRDLTNGDLTHTAVVDTSGFVANWTANSLFTIGGAVANTCTVAGAYTIDDLRIADTAVDPTLYDTEESIDIPCNTASLVGDYSFDEGAGAVAHDCTADAFDLKLGAGASFVVSPFP